MNGKAMLVGLFVVCVVLGLLRSGLSERITGKARLQLSFWNGWTGPDGRVALEMIRQFNEQNPDLQPLGVVVNRVRVRSSEHTYRINELREIFGPLVLPTVLPDRSAVQQAQGAGLSIQRWGTPGAREVAVALEVLLARLLRTSQLRRRT